MDNRKKHNRSTFSQKPNKFDPRLFHKLTAHFRSLPDFSIIGVQKGGTTTLFRYLSQNPHIVPSRRKEIHYFDFQSKRSLNWYRSHFPSSLMKRINGVRTLTGEATPSYLYYPHVPERMKEILPDIKLIAVLRDPVERAYSHYKMAYRNGVEHRSFFDSIRTEQEWIEKEYDRVCRDESYYSYDLHRRSYLARGIYIRQLKYWTNHFPREQMLILQSETFFKDPVNVIKEVCDFLEVPYYVVDTSITYNVSARDNMAEEERTWLVDYYRMHNENLYEYLGKDLGWSR